ncbi:CvpA family protein [Burkholderia mallei]|uniref:CvpA family protein n=1 Tax=Burkholderia mallei TaxID=13373 RepID=UPI002361D948|nr:CvpA family protein [Burkholderia mallei]
MLTAFDYAVLLVIGLSALRGAWRGFVGEIFGLIGWIAAFLIACRFVGVVLPYIPAIIIGVVLVAGVANALLSRIAQATGLGGVDRSLGMMFGLVRGVLLVLLLVAAAGLTELPKQEFWRDALLRPFAEQGVRELKPLLPDGLAAYIHV